jgi:hypothetical protein
MIKKQLYVAPETEVLELRLEGVIAVSDPKYGDGWNDQNWNGE